MAEARGARDNFLPKFQLKKNYKIIRLYRCIQGRFEVINSTGKISDG